MLDKCPNRASKEWKLLVSQMNENEDNAWLLWKANGYSFPKALQTISQIKKAVGIKKEMSNLQVALMAKRLAKYNDKFGTSHSFKANKIGQADLYNIDLTVSYWPKKVMTQVVASKDYSIVGTKTVKDFINSNPNFYYKEGNEYVRDGEVYPSYEDMVDYLPATIKPGVSELFEQNPELANNVYKALGLVPEKLTYRQIEDILYKTNEYRASLFPNLESLYLNSARLKGFNISHEKASINFLKNILKEARKGEELRGDYEDIKELITDAIDNSKLNNKDKKELSSKKDNRAELNIAVTKKLFIARSKGKINFELHNNLGYMNTNEEFNKNASKIIKKLK